MTNETLAKSLESESKSGQGAAISIFGVYWIALRSKQGSKLIVTRMATMMAIPSHWGRLYFYMDEDNFDHEDVSTTKITIFWKRTRTKTLIPKQKKIYFLKNSFNMINLTDLGIIDRQQKSC